MAKRYKESKNKKVNKTKIILFFLVIIVIIGIVIFINNKPNNEEKNNTENIEVGKQPKIQEEVLQEITETIKKDDNKLSSNLLDPEEVCKEVKTISNEEIGNGYIVKINYQIKTLEEGKLFLYYKLENSNVIVIEINIEDKQIENITNYDGNDLAEKPEIKDNLKEDISKYFEKSKSKLEEESKVNIIITETDIISNIIVI